MQSRTARVALIVGLVVALVALVGVAGTAQYVADHSDGDHPMNQNHGSHGDSQVDQNHDGPTEQGSRRTNGHHSEHAHGSCGR